MTRRTVTIVTYDWLPEFPRGFVRDLRARWTAEEAGIPYRVETVPSHPRSDAHRAMQPFAQVPVLKDGDLTLFESGAIALYLAEGSALLPEARRPEITQWVIAALNSVEPAIGNWMRAQLAKTMPGIFGPPVPADVEDHLRSQMDGRLTALAARIADRDWIAGDFSAADIILVEVLRVLSGAGALEGFPALQAYIARATTRPAFQRAMADHMAHWAEADRARKAGA